MSLVNAPLTAVCSWTFLASSNRRLDYMGRRFKPGGSQVEFEHLLMIAIVLIVLTVLAWLVTKWFNARQENGYSSPRRLFNELCRAHGLRRSERELLREIAGWHRIGNPVQLFIEAHRFEAAAMLKDLGRSEEIAAIRQRLFEAQTQGPEA